jgi:spoIIIJ-associated protein
MEFIEVSAKTVNDAITEACQKLEVTSDKLEYEVVEEGSSGFLGIGSKPAIIKARVQSSVEDTAKDFLKEVFEAMNLAVVVDVKYDEAENTMNIDLNGDEMGVLIGKRGQTLDSLQYLVSLVVNKNVDNYIRVKVDTENYRQRRKDTLENLAKNIAYKVKRTKRPVSLEPMNPYERRIIHSALQNDKYVTTYSEGDEPFRHVVVVLKKYDRGERKYEKNYEKSYEKSYEKNEEE